MFKLDCLTDLSTSSLMVFLGNPSLKKQVKGSSIRLGLVRQVDIHLKDHRVSNWCDISEDRVLLSLKV